MREIENSIGFYLCDNVRMIKRAFSRRLSDKDITRAQWSVLWRLACADGVSQAELAELAEIEQPSLVRHVDNLEELGWVERKRDARDRRINRVHLTTRGKKLMEDAWARGADLYQAYTAGISEEELEQLRGLLKRVQANLLNMQEQEVTPNKKSA